MEKWRIRDAIPADAKSLKICMESAYSVYKDRLDPNSLPPLNADYSTEIRNYPAWVVELDNEIIGGLIMTFDDGRASIANIAVKPNFQGQGIGVALMRFAESKAKDQGFSELQLATHKLLDENVLFYEHRGWTQTDQDASKVFMKKTITDQ